jgi:DNA repair ATPase RecN
MSTAVLEEVLEKVGELTLEEQAKVRETIEQNEREAERERRLAVSKQIMGKYRDKLSSVDEFLVRKQEEIDMEDKGWLPPK